MNFAICRGTPGTWFTIQGTATKFDLRKGDYGDYGLGSLTDTDGESQDVLFTSKKGKPTPTADCLNRLATYGALYDANTQKYKVMFNSFAVDAPNSSNQAQNTQAEQKSSQTAAQGPDWDAKQLREHRGYAVRDATLLVMQLAEINQTAQGMKPDLVLEIAEKYINYIYNGISPAQTAKNELGDRFDQPADAVDKTLGPGPNNIPFLDKLGEMLATQATMTDPKLLQVPRPLTDEEKQRLYAKCLERAGKFPVSAEDVNFLYTNIVAKDIINSI